jgi:hypothetical protein
MQFITYRDASGGGGFHAMSPLATKSQTKTSIAKELLASTVS